MTLTIGNTYIRQESGRTLLCAPVTIDGQTREAFFSVLPEYAQYLTAERADAFVVGFLTTAMRTGCNIVCRTPVTKRLYHQITTHMIPLLTGSMERYHPISIDAPLAEDALPCDNAVGTGWTGGVDCSYTLMNHLHLDNPGYQLTHLVIANNGALESKDNRSLLAYMADRARNGIAAELDLKVVDIDSNLHLLQQEHYMSVAAFRLPAVILAVQKLFGVFLHSAGFEFEKFKLDETNSAYYELLLLHCFETDCTSFYSANGATPRIRKLEDLSDFPLAHRYLHPCIYAKGNNCGTCGKCVRTQAALYALGTLDRFRSVFPVDNFLENKTQYLAQIVMNKDRQHYREVLDQMRISGIPITREILESARRQQIVQRVSAHMKAAGNKKNNREQSE